MARLTGTTPRSPSQSTWPRDWSTLVRLANFTGNRQVGRGGGAGGGLYDGLLAGPVERFRYGRRRGASVLWRSTLLTLSGPVGGSDAARRCPTGCCHPDGTAAPPPNAPRVWGRTRAADMRCGVTADHQIQLCVLASAPPAAISRVRAWPRRTPAKPVGIPSLARARPLSGLLAGPGAFERPLTAGGLGPATSIARR
jgi:hypothetical protein